MKPRPLLSAAAVAAALALTLSGTSAHGAGFQQGSAADPEGKPLEIGIWYPSAAPATSVAMGPTTMEVAVGAPLRGQRLPLVVLSHGSGGLFLSHHDTAIALAGAGFVVAAVTHTGDNHADQSRSTDVMDRPRQVSRVLDHMLARWDGRDSIDPSRIGLFGFSSGGFTALAILGGVPDFSRIGPVCAQHPLDYACALLAKSGAPARTPRASPAGGAADPRIKAAVVVAPALGFTFAPDGLRGVRAPIQLWHAEHDLVVPHPRYAEAVRLALPQAPEYHVVADAGHFDFMAPCSSALAKIAPAICASAAGFDRPAFHARFNAAIVEFFRRHLPGHGSGPSGPRKAG